jgi:endoglucanase
MTNGAPDYRLDPLFIEFLDQAVDWAEKHKLYIILDNHSFDPVAATDPDIDAILIPVWTQMALHYKDRSDYILYEVLNEPHGIDAARWAAIQEKVVKTIREIDDRHSIIVGGIAYNSIDALFDLPVYNYDNIIYTFHFYDPYLFTHQGETWGSPPNLKTLKGLPFPANARALPEIPRDLQGTWIEQSMKHSYKKDATVQALAKQLDKAAQFSRERGNLPVFCGEFGVFIPNSLPEDRVRWYQTVTHLLVERGIARTSWDYYGGFGIFKADGGGSFDSGLNIEVVKAMGFSPPRQKAAEPIRGGFTVFDNYPLSPAGRVISWGCDVNLYHEDAGKYVISWGNADRYGAFFFTFKQKIDWEYAASHGYAVTFKAKTDKSARFDVRFIDREDDSGLPWRMNTTVYVEADGQWHTLRIPLASMKEQGAWISATQEWRNPHGQFSWVLVDNLAFVADNNDLHGITILFDSIKIEL